MHKLLPTGKGYVKTTLKAKVNKLFRWICLSSFIVPKLLTVLPEKSMEVWSMKWQSNKQNKNSFSNPSDRSGTRTEGRFQLTLKHSPIFRFFLKAQTPFHRKSRTNQIYTTVPPTQMGHDSTTWVRISGKRTSLNWQPAMPLCLATDHANRKIWGLILTPLN